jgi:tryptophan-rich sensory protein
MTAKTAPRWLPIALGAVAALGVAGLGALSTELGDWYYQLRQPSWKPPDALFGPIWTTIFALAAISGVLAWRNARDPRQRDGLMGLFAGNAVLNVLWSLLFFRLRRPDWALIEVGFLWLSIALLIFATARVSRAASVLLVPYLLWVTFAAALNYAVVQLNGPFG